MKFFFRPSPCFLYFCQSLLRIYCGLKLTQLLFVALLCIVLTVKTLKNIIFFSFYFKNMLGMLVFHSTVASFFSHSVFSVQVSHFFLFLFLSLFFLLLFECIFIYMHYFFFMYIYTFTLVTTIIISNSGYR